MGEFLDAGSGAAGAGRPAAKCDGETDLQSVREFTNRIKRGRSAGIGPDRPGSAGIAAAGRIVGVRFCILDRRRSSAPR